MPTPKRLILSLLSAPALGSIEISTLLAWGSLFGIDAATMRVATGRLTRQGLLDSPRRGVYIIGPEGEYMASTARNWLHAEQRTVPWQGEWVLAHTAHLGRSNKRALRMRERAFRLNGFREYVVDLWCRPANLAEPVTTTRARLLTLGLAVGAVVVRAVEIHGAGDRELFELWPGELIDAAYQAQMAAMKESTQRLKSLDLPEAAKESFLVGDAVIRQINADPLLPEPVINTRDRRAMIKAMVNYDALGREIWRKFMASNG